MPVSDISDEKLLERAVRNAKPRDRQNYRWVAVMETFGLGSGYSCELCARFGLNPEDKVKR